MSSVPPAKPKRRLSIRATAAPPKSANALLTPSAPSALTHTVPELSPPSSVSTIAPPPLLPTPSSSLSQQRTASASVSGRSLRTLRTTMDPSQYKDAVASVEALSVQNQSALPSHLNRNLNSEPSTTRQDNEPSSLRSKEELEENEKLRAKAANLSWDDKVKYAQHVQNVRQEVLSTEATYITNLRDLCEFYVNRLTRAESPEQLAEYGITLAQRVSLVSNFLVIFKVQEEFAKTLTTAGPGQVENVITSYSQFFRVYATYATQYQEMIETFITLKDNKRFQAFVTTVEKALVEKQNQVSIPNDLLLSYFILPIQRIPRYELLLRDLKNHTLPDDPAFVKISDALSQIKATATSINLANHRAEDMAKLVALSRRIKGSMGDLVLVEPHRRFISETTVVLHEPSRKSFFGTIKVATRIIFLLNDIMVWTNSDFEFKSYLNIASISSLNVLSDFLIEITTAEKYFHINFDTAKLCPDKSDPKYDEIKNTCDTWMAQLTSLVDEQQAERRRKRTIQSRHNTSRTQTHSMIVSKFSTLDKSQMRELQAQAAAANAAGGFEEAAEDEEAAAANNAHAAAAVPPIPSSTAPPTDGSTRPPPPGNGFKMRSIPSRRP